MCVFNAVKHITTHSIYAIVDAKITDGIWELFFNAFTILNGFRFVYTILIYNVLLLLIIIGLMFVLVLGALPNRSNSWRLVQLRWAKLKWMNDERTDEEKGYPVIVIVVFAVIVFYLSSLLFSFILMFQNGIILRNHKTIGYHRSQ